MSLPKSVLFICTGNTCRSPMAEGLLKAALQSRSKEDVQVASAGVSSMGGQSASRETQDVLARKGASLAGFRSQRVSASLLKQADLVIAMTASHADLLRRYFPVESGDVKLLCDFIHPDECLTGLDIADPIGMGQAAYEEVAEMMQLAMPGIMNAL